MRMWPVTLVLLRFIPYQPEETVQGALQLLYELQEDLAEITGMDAVTLQPAAGPKGNGRA